jgi:hypothetical protein
VAGIAPVVALATTVAAVRAKNSCRSWVVALVADPSQSSHRMIVHRAPAAEHSQTAVAHKAVVLVAADPIGVARTVVAHRVAEAVAAGRAAHRVAEAVAAGRAAHRAIVRWAVAAAPVDPIGVVQRAVAWTMMVAVVACSYYRPFYGNV